MSVAPAGLTTQEASVVGAVDALAEELVEFLRELVRIPTVNPPGENYPACAELLGRRLKEFGYEVLYVPAEGRPEHTVAHPRINVIGRLAAGTRRPLLHFNGHFDVVPAGSGWTVEPFDGLVRDGRVYGRGVTDQKAGLAASLFAVEAIRRAGLRLRGTVEQSGTVDEESGGFAGVAYLAERGYIARDRTDYVIITEPMNPDRVCLGHRGTYWFQVTTCGRIAHGSMPFLGVSAIHLMNEFISVLTQELKPQLEKRSTRMPVEPPLARRPSLNINSIAGGQLTGGLQTPCVADRCTATFDRRFLLEEPVEQVQGEIRALLERLRARVPQFDYELEELLLVRPVQTEATAPVVSAVAGAVRDILGQQPALMCSPGTYDQKHVVRLGLVEQCLAYGPGLLELAHQSDEYCRIDDLLAACKVMAVAAMRLLGVEADSRP